MRIAIISNAHSAAGGGAGRIAQIYKELLRARGHEILQWGPIPDFQRLSRMNAFARLRFHLNDLAVDEKIAKEVCIWKPDVIITHNLTGCGMATAEKIRQSGIRWVHVLHDVQLVEPSGQIVEGESLYFLRQIWRSLWSSARLRAFGTPTVIISPSHWLFDFYASWNWFEKAERHIIPNPMPRLEVSTKHELDRVLYVGRLDADKGIDVLLSAWSRLDRPNKKLVCIGSGAWEEKLRQKTDPTIEYLGPQSPTRVLEEMSRAALVIVPSRVWENQPTVILEALSVGCEVIATRVGGIPELVEHVGTLIPAGDAQALLQAMKKVLENPADPMATEEERIELLNQHDPEACVRALEQTLQ